MYSNVNLAAPVGVLAFLGTALLLALLLGVTLIALLRSRASLAKLSSLTGLTIIGIYFGLMLAFSLAGSRHVLARGQEKYFCEIDCHLAYSVVDSRETKALGPSNNQLTASGVFHVITIKTRFDEQTISAHRGNSFLYPNPRTLALIDEQGREYRPVDVAEKALVRAGEQSTELTTPLRPGESYITLVAFDVPTDAKDLTLLINESDWITRLIIGHENSWRHRPPVFQL